MHTLKLSCDRDRFRWKCCFRFYAFSFYRAELQFALKFRTNYNTGQYQKCNKKIQYTRNINMKIYYYSFSCGIQEKNGGYGMFRTVVMVKLWKFVWSCLKCFGAHFRYSALIFLRWKYMELRYRCRNRSQSQQTLTYIYIHYQKRKQTKNLYRLIFKFHLHKKKIISILLREKNF